MKTKKVSRRPLKRLSVSGKAKPRRARPGARPSGTKKGKGMGTPPDKGWAKHDPRNISTRRKMPKGCFLDKANLGYPVCDKTTRGRVKLSCKALAAARNRACQHGKASIARAAYKKALGHGCKWARSPSASDYVCPSKPRYGKVRKK